MLKRDQWLDLARKLDWEFSLRRRARGVSRGDRAASRGCRTRRGATGTSRIRTTYAEYVANQHGKDAAVHAVREAVGRLRGLRSGSTRPGSSARQAARRDACRSPSSPRWSATCARRASAATAPGARRPRFGALDELRHTQIPLLLMHELVELGPAVRLDAQVLPHRTTGSRSRRATWSTSCCCAPTRSSSRSATNFVFETGFTNLQFVGLSSMAHARGRPHVREDAAEHPDRRGAPRADRPRRCSRSLIEHDRDYAQYLVDNGSGAAGCSSRS